MIESEKTRFALLPVLVGIIALAAETARVRRATSASSGLCTRIGRMITDLLQALHDECEAKVTGSYARGLQNNESDLDLVVTSQRRLKRAISIFERFELPWDSILVGQIASKPNSLPIQIEVMWKAWLTPIHKKDRRQSVTIYGIEFDTY